MRPGRSIRGRFMGVIKRDRRAVAAQGCNTHTQRAAAEAAWSRRHSWRHRTPWRQCRNSASSGQALPGSKAVGRNHSATGGHAEESLKHRARDAGEKADLRFYKIPRCRSRPGSASASAWRHAGARGSVRPPASRAPSDFFPERIGRMTRAQNAPRERWRLA